MKNIFLILLVCAGVSSQAKTAPGPIGAGVMIGTILSFTGKYWLTNREAVDFGLGFGWSRGTAIYADYVWHFPGMFGSGTQFGRETAGYIGAGPGIGFWSNSYGCGHWRCNDRPTDSGTGVFARGFFGFEWFPKTTRLGVFAELGPTLLIVPGFGGILDIGLGVRYYF